MKSCAGKPKLKRLMSSRKKGSVAAPGGPATNKASGFAISATAFAVALLAASPQAARAANECGDGGGRAGHADLLRRELCDRHRLYQFQRVDAQSGQPGHGGDGCSRCVNSGSGRPGDPSTDRQCDKVNTITTTGSAVTLTNAGSRRTSLINDPRRNAHDDRGGQYRVGGPQPKRTAMPR